CSRSFFSPYPLPARRHWLPQCTLVCLNSPRHGTVMTDPARPDRSYFALSLERTFDWGPGLIEPRQLAVMDCKGVRLLRVAVAGSRRSMSPVQAHSQAPSEALALRPRVLV